MSSNKIIANLVLSYLVNFHVFSMVAAAGDLSFTSISNPNGINQSRDQFWTRVEQGFNNSRTPDVGKGGKKRSVQSRMQVILAAISKLKGCIKQVEQLNPSGASEMDIIIRVKESMKQDKNYKKGFKFDHVWSITKDVEKFAATSNLLRPTIQMGVDFVDSSQSDIQTTDSPTQVSLGLSSFELNLSFENIGGRSWQRQLRLKKSKLKKKKQEIFSQKIESMKIGQEKIIEMIEQGHTYREQNNQLHIKRLEQNQRKLDQNQEKIEQNRALLVRNKEEMELTRFQEENKILLFDLNSIQDPCLRENFRAEQLRILHQRKERDRAIVDSNGGRFFGGIGGSGSNLAEF